MCFRKKLCSDGAFLRRRDLGGRGGPEGDPLDPMPASLSPRHPQRGGPPFRDGTLHTSQETIPVWQQALPERSLFLDLKLSMDSRQGVSPNGTVLFQKT